VCLLPKILPKAKAAAAVAVKKLVVVVDEVARTL
jgi:hypothetical protein